MRVAAPRGLPGHRAGLRHRAVMRRSTGWREAGRAVGLATMPPRLGQRRVGRVLRGGVGEASCRRRWRRSPCRVDVVAASGMAPRHTVGLTVEALGVAGPGAWRGTARPSPSLAFCPALLEVEIDTGDADSRRRATATCSHWVMVVRAASPLVSSFVRSSSCGRVSSWPVRLRRRAVAERLKVEQDERATSTHEGAGEPGWNDGSRRETLPLRGCGLPSRPSALRTSRR